MPIERTPLQSFCHQSVSYFWLLIGAFLAALSIRVFLFPNQLIDGGIVGIALILARLFPSAAPT